MKNLNTKTQICLTISSLLIIVSMLTSCNSEISLELVDDTKESSNSKKTSDALANTQEYISLDVLPLGWGGLVTDMASEVNFDTLFVSFGNKGVRIYNVSDKENPDLLSVLNFGDDDRITGLELKGDNLYVMGLNEFLYVYNVSNPSSPVLLSQKYITSSSYGMAISGDYLYITGAGNGLYAVDISDPTNPTTVRNLYGSVFGSTIFPYDISILGTTAFIADRFNSRIVSLDVSNPAVSITALDEFVVTGYPDSLDVIDSSHILIGSSPTIIDVSDPSDMTSVAVVPDLGSENFAINGDNLYMANTAGIQIFDISDLSTPTLIKTFSDSYTSSSKLHFADSHLYVTSNSEGVIIYDMTNPILESNKSTIHSNSNLYDVVLSKSGNYGYAASSNGLITLNYSNKGDPSFVSMDNSLGGEIRSINIVDETIFVYDYTNATLNSYDISNTPEAPQFISSLNVSSSSASGKTIIHGDKMIIPMGTGGVDIVDISSPENMVLLKNIDTAGVSSTAKIVENNLYIADGSNGLLIYDITNLNLPVEIGHFNVGINQVLDLEVKNSFVYLANRSNGLTIVDITDKANPVFHSDYNPTQFINSVSIVEDYIYIGSSSGGVSYVDISDPSSPSLINTIEHASDVRVIRNRDNYLAVINDSGGMYWIDATDVNNITFKD